MNHGNVNVNESRMFGLLISSVLMLNARRDHSSIPSVPSSSLSLSASAKPKYGQANLEAGLLPESIMADEAPERSLAAGVGHKLRRIESLYN